MFYPPLPNPLQMSPLPLSSVNHVSRVCRDVNKSRRFYRDLLGMVEVKRPSNFDFEGAWLLGAGIGIHLIAGTPPVRSETINPRGDHISFHSDDIPGVVARLRELSVPFVLADVQEGPILVTQVFFHDPDHNMIEVCDCNKLPITELTPAYQEANPGCLPCSMGVGAKTTTQELDDEMSTSMSMQRSKTIRNDRYENGAVMPGGLIDGHHAELTVPQQSGKDDDNQEENNLAYTNPNPNQLSVTLPLPRLDLVRRCTKSTKTMTTEMSTHLEGDHEGEDDLAEEEVTTPIFPTLALSARTESVSSENSSEDTYPGGGDDYHADGYETCPGSSPYHEQDEDEEKKVEGEEEEEEDHVRGAEVQDQITYPKEEQDQDEDRDRKGAYLPLTGELEIRVQGINHGFFPTSSKASSRRESVREKGREREAEAGTSETEVEAGGGAGDHENQGLREGRVTWLGESIWEQAGGFTGESPPWQLGPLGAHLGKGT